MSGFADEMWDNAVFVATAMHKEKLEIESGERIAVSVLAADVPMLEAAPLLLAVCTALLLFHKGGPWTLKDQNQWNALLGPTEATTKTLCDFARIALAKAAGVGG